MGKMSKHHHHHHQQSSSSTNKQLQLGNFTGRKWGDWERACEQNGVKADSNNGVGGSGKKQNTADMEVKQITRKEQPLFGFHPDREQVYVVICEHCKRPFKPQAFQCHLENNHRSYRKEKVVREIYQRPMPTPNIKGKNFRNKTNNKQQFTAHKPTTPTSGGNKSRDVTPTERMKSHGSNKSGVSLKIPNRKSSSSTATVVPTPINAKLVASRGGTPEPKSNNIAVPTELKKQVTPSSGEKYSSSPSSKSKHHHHPVVKKVASSASSKVVAPSIAKVAATMSPLPHDGAILNGSMTTYTKQQINNNKQKQQNVASKPDSKPPTPTPSFDILPPIKHESTLLYHVPRSPVAPIQLPPPTPTGQVTSQQHSNNVMSSSSSSGGSPLPQLSSTSSVVIPPSRPSSRGKCIPLKEREYDPEKHCGVPTGRELSPCTRSLTCKTHTINMKRKVVGRRKPYDDLLREARNNQQIHRMMTSSDHVRLRHSSSYGGSDVSSPETRTGSNSSGMMMMSSHDVISSNHQRNSNFFFPLRQTAQIRCIDCCDAIQPQHNNIHHYNNYMTSSFLTYHPRPLVQTNISVLSRFNKSRKRKKFSSFSKLTNPQATTNTQTTTKFQFTPISSSVTAQSPATATDNIINKNKMAVSSSSRKRGASSEQENGGGGQRRLSSGSSSSGSKRSKLQQSGGGKKNKVQVVDISSVMMHNNNSTQDNQRQNSLATLLQQPPQSGTQSFKRPTSCSGGAAPSGKFIVTTGGSSGGKNHVIPYTSSSLPPSRGGSGSTQSKTTRKLMMTSQTKQQQRRLSGNSQQRVTNSNIQQQTLSSALYGATAGQNVVTVTSEAGSSAYTLMDLVDTLGASTPTSSSNNQMFDDGKTDDGNSIIWPQNGGFIINNQQQNRNPTTTAINRRIRDSQNSNNNNNNNATSNLVEHFIQGTATSNKQQRINIKTNLQRRNRQAQIRRINTTQQPQQRIITTNNQQQQQNIIFSINTTSSTDSNRRQQIIQIPPKTSATTPTNYYTEDNSL